MIAPHRLAQLERRPAQLPASGRRRKVSGQSRPLPAHRPDRIGLHRHPGRRSPRATLYGDVGDYDIGDWASQDAGDYNRELFVDCDGARGMCGSAMYTPDSPGGLVALGVYSQFPCTAAACADDPDRDYPNIITRVTPEYAGFISLAKSLWSCAASPCN